MKSFERRGRVKNMALMSILLMTCVQIERGALAQEDLPKQDLPTQAIGNAKRNDAHWASLVQKIAEGLKVPVVAYDVTSAPHLNLKPFPMEGFEKANSQARLDVSAKWSGSKWHSSPSGLVLPQPWIPRYFLDSSIQLNSPKRFWPLFLSGLSEQQIQELGSGRYIKVDSLTESQKELLSNVGSKEEELGSGLLKALDKFQNGFLDINIDQEAFAFYKGKMLFPAMKPDDESNFILAELDLIPTDSTFIDESLQVSLSTSTFHLDNAKIFSFVDLLSELKKDKTLSTKLQSVEVSRQVSESRFVVTSGDWKVSDLLTACCIATRAEIRRLGEQMLVAPHQQVARTLAFLGAQNVQGLDDDTTKTIESTSRLLKSALAPLAKGYRNRPDSAGLVRADVKMYSFSELPPEELKFIEDEGWPPISREFRAAPNKEFVEVVFSPLLMLRFREGKERDGLGLGFTMNYKWLYFRKAAESYGVPVKIGSTK